MQVDDHEGDVDTCVFRVNQVYLDVQRHAAIYPTFHLKYTC